LKVQFFIIGIGSDILIKKTKIIIINNNKITSNLCEELFGVHYGQVFLKIFLDILPLYKKNYFYIFCPCKKKGMFF
jgi:hypothetical protein